MANDYIEVLENARRQLVESRRGIAEKLAGGYQRGDTEKWREAFRDIQATIDAVDRAAQEEHRLGPSVYETEGIKSV